MERRQVTYTVAEVANILRCCKRTIYNRILEGVIQTCSRTGRGILITGETLDAILAGRMHFSREGIRSQTVQPAPPTHPTQEQPKGDRTPTAKTPRKLKRKDKSEGNSPSQ